MVYWSAITALLLIGCGIEIKPKKADVEVSGEVNHKISFDLTQLQQQFYEQCQRELGPEATEAELIECRDNYIDQFFASLGG